MLGLVGGCVVDVVLEEEEVVVVVVFWWFVGDDWIELAVDRLQFGGGAYQTCTASQTHPSLPR